MKTYFVVAHNHNGYAYIREVLETSTTVYTDCELSGFSTLAEAEQFVAEVDPQLEAKWQADWEANRLAQNILDNHNDMQDWLQACEQTMPILEVFNVPRHF